MRNITWHGAEIYYLNSCRARFSGVYLVFEVFQDAWRSNRENPSVHWGATLSCPLMASNMQIRISFRSRSDLVLDADHALEFLEPISFYKCASRFVVFQTKMAHFSFCLVRIKMSLLTWHGATKTEAAREAVIKRLDVGTPVEGQLVTSEPARAQNQRNDTRGWQGQKKIYTPPQWP